MQAITSKPRRIGWKSTLHGETAEMLHSRDFVTRCAIVFCYLGFDHDLWIELIWHDKIRRLIETADALRAPGLAKADFCYRQLSFDCRF